jgi:hypothetical protein
MKDQALISAFIAQSTGDHGTPALPKHVKNELMVGVPPHLSYAIHYAIHAFGSSHEQ